MMMGVAGKKKARIALAVWLLLALGMLLAPAPREWGAFGKRISASYDKAQPALQPAAHMALMASCSFLLMGFFLGHPLGRAFSYSIGLALAAAILLEMLQSFLPVRFARECDLLDLWPSLIGAVIGGIAGAIIRLRATS